MKIIHNFKYINGLHVMVAPNLVGAVDEDYATTLSTNLVRSQTKLDCSFKFGLGLIVGEAYA